MIAWLLDTLLYTGLLIAFVLLVRRPAGRWFGPRFAYALWALPFLRLLLPPIILPASLAPESEAFSAAAMPPDAASELAAAAAKAPETVTFVPGMLAATAPYSSDPLLAWDELALLIWVAGALAFLGWRVAAYRAMRRDLLAEARPVGEIGKIRIVETPELGAPVAFGVLDKVIGLPNGFMAQEDRLARDLAIAHELAHHRGRDLLANFAAQGLLSLHWFNPVAWFGWRAMRRDQEAACDARVLDGRGKEDRVRYATLIAGMAAGPRLALAAPMACPLLGQSSIVHRLRSISMSEVPARRLWLGRMLAGGALLALPLTASISYAAATTRAPETPVLPAPEPPGLPASPEVPAQPAPTVQAASVEAPSYVHRSEMRSDADVPPPMPRERYRGGNPADPEWQARMDQWQKEMQEWATAMTEYYTNHDIPTRAQAVAYAASARRSAPELIESCDERDLAAADGRRIIVICKRDIRAQAFAGARSGLHSARVAIAGDARIDPETRAEILRDLDEGIADIDNEAEQGR